MNHGPAWHNGNQVEYTIAESVCRTRKTPVYTLVIGDALPGGCGSGHCRPRNTPVSGEPEFTEPGRRFHTPASG